MVNRFQRNGAVLFVDLTTLPIEAREEFEAELEVGKDLRETANRLDGAIIKHPELASGVLEPSLYSGLPKQLVEIRYVDF